MQRLVELGAQTVEWDYVAEADYVVVTDPDENRFCVIDADEE
jgi:hypothetical protein